MSKEKEEAIKILKNRNNLVLFNIDFLNITATEDFKKLDKAIETVLQALENSIPKEVIREKINERQFELQQEYKDFKDDIVLKTLQDIYYGGEK